MKYLITILLLWGTAKGQLFKTDGDILLGSDTVGISLQPTQTYKIDTFYNEEVLITGTKEHPFYTSGAYHYKAIAKNIKTNKVDTFLLQAEWGDQLSHIKYEQISKQRGFPADVLLKRNEVYMVDRGMFKGINYTFKIYNP